MELWGTIIILFLIGVVATWTADVKQERIEKQSKKEQKEEESVVDDTVLEAVAENHEQPTILVKIEDPYDVDVSGWHSDIFFNDSDPQDWDEYKGQERIKEFVQLQIDVMQQEEGLKLLFIATKGQGKTALFRIIGKKILEKRGGRYIEITPAMLKKKKQVDNLMASLIPGDVLCIDEIHMFNRDTADLLLPAIEGGIYPFDHGMTRIASPICWIGATTDVGLLPEAFQDRFQVKSLETLSLENLRDILLTMPFNITKEAALEVAVRAVSSPRELKKVAKLARDVSIRDNDPIITPYHCSEAFRLLDLDEFGLYGHDRLVLEALKNNPKRYASGQLRHAHSERAIRALTGLDEKLYRDQIEPKLLKQGFITISSGGRELTDKAWSTYFVKSESNHLL